MSERLIRAEAIFHEVREAPAKDRERLLSERCGNDADLRRFVEQLLAHDTDGMGSFLSPVVHEGSDEPARPAPPSRIGPYEIVAEINEGGMGMVYLARQTPPLEREVALKVVRAGMDSREVVARFETERQALALMDHPHIAKVLDAGETEEGQPYFVMELIRGEPITAYCDRRRLDLRRRLELFRQVCDAVQHAHQKAVIHRDLKPSNVLVSEVDGRPVPKVIDFGVAKAVGRKLTSRTVHTNLGVLIGTLEYMSPEQADLDNADVDTRADVYSLGVILYELLTGERPFEGGATLTLLRRIREEEPRRPSTRITAADRGSEERARARGSEATALRRVLHGDLDWIVMRALEKDRVLRYPSAAEMAADIGHYLRDETVTARPPSRAYRMRKFVRRHRLAMVSVLLVTVALLVAVAGTSVGLVRARRAEARARAEQESSQRAADFLASTLGGIDPAGIARDLAATLRRRGPSGAAASMSGADSTLNSDPRFNGLNLIDVVRNLIDHHVLDGAVQRIDKQLGAEPALASDLYHAIGNAYDRPEASFTCLRRAAELSERARGRDDVRTIEDRLGLGWCYTGMSQYAVAESLDREILASARRKYGDDAGITMKAVAALGGTLQQRSIAWLETNDPSRRPMRTRWTDEAEGLARKVLEWRTRELGPDAPAVLDAQRGLAQILCDEGQYAEAEVMLRHTIERSSRLYGPYDGSTLGIRLTLAYTVFYSGRVDEAVAMARGLMEDSRRVLGDNNGIALIIEEKMGLILLNRGYLDEAGHWLRDAAPRLSLLMGDESHFSRECMQSLARLEQLEGTREHSPRATRGIHSSP